MTNHPRSFIVTTSLLALTLLGASACGSDSSSTTNGGAGGGTSTGGNATTGGNGGTTALTGGTQNGGTSNGGEANGGAGGETYAACAEVPTAYPQIAGKTCADFCGGDGDVFGGGFMATCPEGGAVTAEIAGTYGATADECEAICNALSQAALCCRFSHLANAVADAAPGTDVHCTHAAGDGTVCQ